MVFVSGSDFSQKEGVFAGSTTPTLRLQNMLTHTGRGRKMDEKDVFMAQQETVESTKFPSKYTTLQLRKLEAIGEMVYKSVISMVYH